MSRVSGGRLPELKGHRPKGQWPMVNGQWSMVNGQWSMANGICGTVVSMACVAYGRCVGGQLVIQSEFNPVTSVTAQPHRDWEWEPFAELDSFGKECVHSSSCQACQEVSYG